MADLTFQAPELIDNQDVKSEPRLKSVSDTSTMIARRDCKRVEKDFKNKLDDIVVECFDKEYQIQPKIKKTDDIETKGRKGVYHARSFEKIEQWRRTVEKMY